jgi:glycosyltransferase involved in cell wall biosynthesis
MSSHCAAAMCRDWWRQSIGCIEFWRHCDEQSCGTPFPSWPTQKDCSNWEAPPWTVEVTPNGVDTEKFYPAAATRDDGVFRVLAVGRLQEQKNNAFAMRVLAGARARIPQRLEYHIVGDGPLRSDLQKHAVNLGLAEQVFWHGWLPREQLPEQYRSCDCLFAPDAL